MLSISIEKQRTRPPFFEFVFGIRMGGGLAGGGAKTCQTEIYYRIVFLLFQMLSLSKQRKCWPFLKLCLGDQTEQTKIYYRIVHFYCFKCFRLLLKSKGHARLFFKFCLAYGWAGGWRAEGPRLGKRKYIIELFIFTVSNASA